MKNNVRERVEKMSALELACEYNRLLILSEEEDLSLIKLVDAKMLLYVEEELKARLYKLLPGLPKLESKPIVEPEGVEHFNPIQETYTKRKSRKSMTIKEAIERKSKFNSEPRFRFFVKVINSLNTPVASIPVMATSKDDAIKQARSKSIKFGKGLTFEVS